MKKIYMVILGLLIFMQTQAQKGEERQLIWSIGEVEMIRGEQIRVNYPVLVSIGKADNSPQLGTSTMRFFYDAGQLSDLSIENIRNEYQVSGLSQSNDVFGEVFGFAGGGGIYAQFNLMANARNLLDLSTEPVHVMDLSFTVLPGARIPFCAPLVLDNNSKTNKQGSIGDSGYLFNTGGIIGTYYLNHKTNAVYLADDEVQNYLWEKSPAFDKVIDQLGDKAGQTVRLKSKMCLEPEKPAIPADLDRFDAHKAGDKKVRLDWNTRSEFNNSFFEIQRSSDGFAFEPIGSVQGQWNTVEETNYEFLDEHPLPGINYYRLMQVDNNGHTEFSGIREVEFEAAGFAAVDGNLKVAYYPNPSRGVVQLSSNKSFTNFEVSVYDANGRFILKKNNVDAGSSLDLSSLSSGVYSLKLADLDQEVIDTQQIVIVDK